MEGLEVAVVAAEVVGGGKGQGLGREGEEGARREDSTA